MTVTDQSEHKASFAGRGLAYLVDCFLAFAVFGFVPSAIGPPSSNIGVFSSAIVRYWLIIGVGSVFVRESERVVL